MSAQGRSPELLPGWDADELTPEQSRRRVPAPPGTFGLRIRTVTEVSRAIRETVRADERLRDVWVEGEVGRVTISSAGHAYFALKDERAQLQCVWFRDDRVRSPFQPQTGLRVVAHGRVDVFEPQGALQLYVEALQPAGFGDLAIRFEQLKARLQAEGLFERQRLGKLDHLPGGESQFGGTGRDVDIDAVVSEELTQHRRLLPLVRHHVPHAGVALQLHRTRRARFVTRFAHRRRHRRRGRR